MSNVIEDYTIKAREHLLEYSQYEYPIVKQKMATLSSRFEFLTEEKFDEITAIARRRDIFASIVNEVDNRTRENNKTIIPLLCNFETLYDYIRKYDDIVRVGRRLERDYEYFICSDQDHVYILIVNR